MAETLLQKAQRLGIQPANTKFLSLKKEQAQAEAEAAKISSPFGQAKEFGKALGEFSGITPTGRRIAAGISPYVTPEEELPYVLEQLDPGGMDKPKTFGSQAKELAEIAIDLPVISLGLSKTIAGALEKQAVKSAPELAKFLTKPLSEFAPDIIKNVLKKDISTPIKEKTGELFEKVGNFGKKPTEYLASRFPKLLGIATGESDDIIQIALKNPEIADKGIMGGDEALRSAVREGSSKSVQLRDAFVKGHAEAFRQLAGKNSEKLVSKQRILYDFVDALEKEGAKVQKGGKVDFATSKIKANPGEITKIKDAYEAIVKWKDFTLTGINELKQLVGKLTRFPAEAGGSSKSPFLGKIYHYLDETIKSNLDEASRADYTEMNKKFSEGIELYEDMVDAFNSGDPFVRLANSLGKNKDSLRQTLEFYENLGGEKVLPIVAGRELAMEKTAAFGLLNPRSWIDFFVSPKVQAKAVTKIGETFYK